MVRALTRRAAIHVELGDLEAARADMAAFVKLRDRAGEQVTEPGPVRDRIEAVYAALDGG
ncbi:hypothetical protein [Actinoplanes sp. NPDC048796]|uniref:hypothetical protein n=1 Tax=unclassified Actinoplanes TaxID=2626549 RepID=UPI00340C7A6F